MASKSASKPPVAASGKADTKKIKHMRETFPNLSEEEAAILLQEHDGSLKQAMDAVLGGERWKKVEKPKKAKQDKPEEVASPVERRAPREKREFVPKEKRADRAPAAADAREERKPRPEKKTAAPVAPEAAATTAPVVHQHAEISGTSWVKGKSISFADMLKKTKVAEPVAAPAPAEPTVVAVKEQPKPKTSAPAAQAPTEAAVVEKVTQKASEVAPSAVTEKAEVAAASAPPKPRRERKPRVAPEASATPSAADVSTSQPVAVPVATEAPRAVPPPAPASLPPVAKPSVVEYVLEFDRISEPVTLPSHVEDIVSRFKDAFKFNGTQGRAPTPPPAQVAQAPPVSVAPTATASSFAFQTTAPRQSWPPTEGRSYNQWSETSNNWNARPTTFTSYQGAYQQQQPQFRPQTVGNYGRYNGHHNAHHAASHHRNGVHPDQVASDVAYSAIREEPRFAHNGGVW